MELNTPRQAKVRLVDPETVEAARLAIKPPKVDPKVTPEKAVEILKNWPGGAEAIKQLRAAGKKI